MSHNVQHMPVRGKASAATARKLIASSQRPAPFVLSSTILDEDIEQTTSARIAFSDAVIAGLPVSANSVYYLVVSPKFAHRFYVVVKLGSRYICSSREERIQQYCAKVVAQYASDAQAALVAA